jgi:hypothetical protein
MAPWTREAKDWLVLVCIDAGVPITIAWKRHTGEASATVAIVSGLVSLAVLNAILIVTIRARNKRQDQGVPRSLVIGAIGLMMLGALITSLSVFAVTAHNDYLELALSDKPLNDIHPAQRALVVELLRRRLANSRANNHLIADIKPISPPLFSPDSFASESTIRSVSSAYKNATDADFSYYAQQQEAMNDFRSKMTKVDPGSLKSFEAAQQQQETAEAEGYKMEQESATATLALYQYAAVHAKDITFKNGELAFSTESVRLEFSGQLENSKALFSKWQADVQERARRQQQAHAAVSSSVR